MFESAVSDAHQGARIIFSATTNGLFAVVMVVAALTSAFGVVAAFTMRTLWGVVVLVTGFLLAGSAAWLFGVFAFTGEIAVPATLFVVAGAIAYGFAIVATGVVGWYINTDEKRSTVGGEVAQLPPARTVDGVEYGPGPDKATPALPVPDPALDLPDLPDVDSRGVVYVEDRIGRPPAPVTPSAKLVDYNTAAPADPETHDIPDTVDEFPLPEPDPDPDPAVDGGGVIEVYAGRGDVTGEIRIIDPRQVEAATQTNRRTPLAALRRRRKVL